MLQKRDEAIQSAEQQINEYRDAQASIEARKESMRPGINLLDAITSEGSVSDAHLRMFVNKVYLHEQDGKLSVEFVLNADFQTHLDLYDQNGELTDVCNDLGYYFSRASRQCVGLKWKKERDTHPAPSRSQQNVWSHLAVENLFLSPKTCHSAKEHV